MLPILRGRPSQLIVALLCALVLSRMPAPICAEDAISSVVKIDEGAALALVTTPDVSIAPYLCTMPIGIAAPSRSDRPAPSFRDGAVLRL